MKMNTIPRTLALTSCLGDRKGRQSLDVALNYDEEYKWRRRIREGDQKIVFRTLSHPHPLKV